ncbi:MAG: hypothetical protein LBH04_12600 [Tannerellaceae bacterium]|nr:hypothetical protein [Tannerellaceae bacterium]
MPVGFPRVGVFLQFRFSDYPIAGVWYKQANVSSDFGACGVARAKVFSLAGEGDSPSIALDILNVTFGVLKVAIDVQRFFEIEDTVSRFFVSGT